MGAGEITDLRNKLGLSQGDFSELLGVTGDNTISRWERGRRAPSETVRRLVCWLNDLPKKEALEVVHALGQYKLKKR